MNLNLIFDRINGPIGKLAPPHPDRSVWSFIDYPMPLIGSFFYLVVILVLQSYMKNRQAIVMKKLWALHNFILTAVSIAMYIGVGKWVIETYLKYGLFSVYCGSPSIKEEQNLMWWVNLFAFTKYYEFLDTVFLVLQKKELSFLHVWHHATVVPMCWFATDQLIVMGWITTFQNSGVHILMYYYYAMSSLGFRIWWRQYLTTIQIIQFAIDCLSSLPFLYFYSNKIPCRGSIQAWMCANFLGISFFVLFLHFYFTNYKRTDSISKPKKQE